MPKASRISTNLFTSAFYTLTGFHGLHVLVGLIALGRHRRGWRCAGDFRGGRRRVAVDTVSIYWHFVDAVWVVVFQSGLSAGAGRMNDEHEPSPAVAVGLAGGGRRGVTLLAFGVRDRAGSSRALGVVLMVVGPGRLDRGACGMDAEDPDAVDNAPQVPQSRVSLWR